MDSKKLNTPDCFDGCPDKDCFQNGYDVRPLSYCKQQMLMDRFQKDTNIIKKSPCNKCIHRVSKLACQRCTHAVD